MAKRETKKRGRAKEPRNSLSQRERIFVAEYLTDLNAARAARESGYAESTAAGKAAVWVKDPTVKPAVYLAVQEGMAARAEKLEIKKEDVLRLWWKIANADVRELIKFIRTCCRRCYGEGHQFQWVDMDEYATEVSRKAAKGQTGPDHAGGFGFDVNRKPNPACPHCAGYGEGRTILMDTDNYSEEAALVYAGVQHSKEGVKIATRNQDDALRNVARHLGMFDNRGPEEKDNPLLALLRQIGNSSMPVRDNDPDFEG